MHWIPCTVVSRDYEIYVVAEQKLIILCPVWVKNKNLKDYEFPTDYESYTKVLCSKSTVNYQLKTLQIVKFVTFLSQNDNMLFICVPSDASSLPLLAGYLLLGIVFYL